MGGYDPGRGMYDAGQVNAPPRDGPRDQHDPGGSRQCHVGRRADGNAPDGFRYMNRDKVKHRGRAPKKKIGGKKEKTEEKRKNRQKIKNGRKKISKKKDRIVWKNRKREKIRERKTGARSKKRGRMRKRVVLEKELGKGKCSGEGLEMMKNAARIMMDMFEKTNAGSTVDVVLRPFQVKLLTLLCRKARTGETTLGAVHSPSPVFGCSLWQTERIRRMSASTVAIPSSPQWQQGSLDPVARRSFRCQMKPCISPASHRFPQAAGLDTQSSCLNFLYNASQKVA